MSASKILESALPSEIQAAMALSLLRLKNGHRLDLEDIAHVMGIKKSAVGNYISGSTKMTAIAWLKVTARWPELNDMMLAELDEAEKAAAAKQRTLKLA
jgi:predicted transcriptional regulator